MIKNIKIARFLKFIRQFSAISCIISYLFIGCIGANAITNWDINGVNSNTILTCDNNGVYVLNFYENNFTANFIFDNYSESRTFRTIGNVMYATANNGNIYVLSNNNGSLILNKYMYNQDSLYNYNLGNLKINNSHKFCVAGDRLYFAENNDSSIFNCYSIYGEKLYSFNMRNVTDYRTDFAGNNFYIFAQDNIYLLNTAENSQPSHILKTNMLFTDVFICDNVAFDGKGNIVDLSKQAMLSTNIASDKINAGVINAYYCKYSNGCVYGYTLDGNNKLLYKTDYNCNAQMLSYGEKLYLLTEYGNLLVINSNELSYANTNHNQSSNNTPDNPPNTGNSNNNSTNNNTNNTSNSNIQHNTTEFSINSYYVDSTKNVIWNIPSGTTISNFKKNLTYSGYSLEFYNKDNIRKTSGTLGTNFTMVVKSNNIEHSLYTISIKGDLTGEGNVNSSDVKILSRYIMEDSSLFNFTDEQYAASDVNDDGIINGIDILMVAKNNL